jgi:hypothetical protein
MHKRFRRAYLLLNSGTCNFSWTIPKIEAICSSKTALLYKSIGFYTLEEYDLRNISPSDG